MSPVLWVLVAWLLFGGTHLLLSSSPLRAAISNRLGANGFVVAYTTVAAVTLTLLIVTVARFGGDGSAGLNFAAEPAARWILSAISLAGAVLMVGGLIDYGHSPMAELARRRRAPDGAADKPLRPPAAFARITRHPFFVGLALLMGAHALLAQTAAGALYFAGFSVLALIGIPLQDRKLLAQHGDIYRDYLRQSSLVPSTSARGPTAKGGRAWPVALGAIAGALVLALLHPLWRLGHGAPFATVVLVGGLFAVWMQLRRRRRG